MLSFIGVAIVVIVAPGPDFALTVRNTVRGGGLATSAGVATGQVVWALATAAGVSALLVASHPAFVALRVLGAAYLVWLGLATLLRHGAHAPRVRTGRPYRQGLLSNLGNPKMPVFFTSLLPQFGGTFAVLASHGLLFAAMTLAWLALVTRFGGLLLRPRLRRVVDAITAVVLVALGVRVATEHR